MPLGWAEGRRDGDDTLGDLGPEECLRGLLDRLQYLGGDVLRRGQAAAKANHGDDLNRKSEDIC